LEISLDPPPATRGEIRAWATDPQGLDLAEASGDVRQSLSVVVRTTATSVRLQLTVNDVLHGTKTLVMRASPLGILSILNIQLDTLVRVFVKPILRTSIFTVPHVSSGGGMFDHLGAPDMADLERQVQARNIRPEMRRGEPEIAMIGIGLGYTARVTYATGELMITRS